MIIQRFSYGGYQSLEFFLKAHQSEFDLQRLLLILNVLDLTGQPIPNPCRYWMHLPMFLTVHAKGAAKERASSTFTMVADLCRRASARSASWNTYHYCSMNQ